MIPRREIREYLKRSIRQDLLKLEKCTQDLSGPQIMNMYGEIRISIEEWKTRNSVQTHLE